MMTFKTNSSFLFFVFLQVGLAKMTFDDKRQGDEHKGQEKELRSDSSINWHVVAGRRHTRTLKLVRDVTSTALILMLCVVLEPIRLTGWCVLITIFACNVCTSDWLAIP